MGGGGVEGRCVCFVLFGLTVFPSLGSQVLFNIHSDTCPFSLSVLLKHRSCLQTCSARS